ncbi:pyrroline-5-carboxylate reductase [Salinibacterium sp.]|uniref:pyrroline-5-carboxylate reductase n=1 Tax=Salinibacterium sp. TaxID=1915057 RepID=UPI00286BB7AE|nr:pyrroline-5-carboxylate reductase [Salinibacterium sp.]
MTTTLPSIAIIGAGSMGGAILGGLMAPGVDASGGIRVTNRTTVKAERLTAPGVTSYALESTPDANLQAVRGAGIVLLGVKPAMIRDTLAEIAPALDATTLIISVAAGVTISTMEAAVPNAVLRAMPNTPALVGRGVTGLAAGSRSTASHRELGRTLFETVGTVLEIPESQIDALSTISGSGPAYVFLLIDELTSTAVRMGFTPEQAAVMVNGTFAGAVELLAASGKTPEQLRLQVTSPKGTTERAVTELQAADLGGLFDRATAAALARARELAAA